MEEPRYGIKEMYDVHIRACAPMDFYGKSYEINETLLDFQKIEISQISSLERTVLSQGGYNNNPQIFWDTQKETEFKVSNGVLSPKGLSLLSNSKVDFNETKSVQMNETLQVIEVDDKGYVDLKFIPNCCDSLAAQYNPNNEPYPMGRRPELPLKPLPPSQIKWIFVYDCDSGEKITNFYIYGNRIILSKEYRKVYIDYTFDYNLQSRTLNLGARQFTTFLKLDGKMSMKSEETGEVFTVLIEIPRIKINSNLSMSLGKTCENSYVSDFFLSAYPQIVGNKKDKESTAKMTFLDSELTGEYI